MRTALMIVSSVLVMSFVLGMVAPAEAKRKQVRRGAVYCQGDHLHYGSSNSFKSRRLAMRDAIESWRGFTVFEYGSQWGHWRLSRNKSVKCGRENGLWRCNIQSTPCRKALRGERGKYK